MYCISSVALLARLVSTCHLTLRFLVFFFFFQAEDGIRDLTVTGVQTCALPISRNIVYRGKLFDAAASNLGIPALGYDRVFQEVHRVLKPSGRFVFSEWPTEPNPSFAALRALLEKHGTRAPSKDLAQVREAVRLVPTETAVISRRE